MHETVAKKRHQPDNSKETPSAKAPRIHEFMSASASNVISQRKVDDLILNFVVSDMQPLSVVEGAGFIHLLEYLNPRVKLMCTETLKTRLTEKFEAAVEQVKGETAGVQYVC